MALEDQLKEQPQEVKGNLTDEEELDLKIAVLMGQNLLDKGGFDVIQKAVDQSKDPGQVVGQFFMQMGQQLMENMPEGMELSPKILLAQGGWVEQMSDYVQEELGINKKIMDKAEIYIASTATQMAQAKQQQGQGATEGVPQPLVPSPEQPMGGP